MRTFSAAENFGLGQTFNMGEADDNIAYSATVKISCVKRHSTFVASRSELIKNSSWRLKRENVRLRKHKKPPIGITDAQALSLAIRSLQRRGWHLERVSDETFIFKGWGRLPSLRMVDPREPEKPRTT